MSAGGIQMGGLLREALRPFNDHDPDEIETFSRLAMTLIRAAVRYAITLVEPGAQRVLAQFKACCRIGRSGSTPEANRVAHND